MMNFSARRRFLSRLNFTLMNPPDSATLRGMQSEMNAKIQIQGLTIVGLMLVAAGIILAFFFQDMSENALMGASTRYKPVIPATSTVDITKAPQCAEGYERPWIGCQSLAPGN